MVYFTNSFFEGDLFKKGGIFKRVVISRSFGMFLFHIKFCGIKDLIVIKF